MDATTINAVFAAAVQSTSWKQLNTGRRTGVSHGSYRYAVELPTSTSSVQAEIISREGYGGVEFMNVAATWGQTAQLVESALAATRIH
jgi:hypothetical protein